MSRNNNDEHVETDRHYSSIDARSLNSAMERAIVDPAFIDNSLKFIASIQFPVYKHTLLDSLKQQQAPAAVMTLFETLDGYTPYHDLTQIREAFEVNRVGKDNKIIQGTRPPEHARLTTPNPGIQEPMPSNPESPKKNTPVTNTKSAMGTTSKDHICIECGQIFQKEEDLQLHRRAEAGAA